MYIKFEDVRLRLVGKVRFTDDIDDENKMPKALAIRLIDEAEGQVEVDLSPRYAAPFVNSAAPNTFASIPDRPTKNIIRTLCELKAVIRILETDFGAGSSVDGAKYIKNIADRYKDIVNNNILAKPSDDFKGSRQWAFPPLPNLQKAYFNTEADDGYAGMGPLVTSDMGESMEIMEDKQSNPSEDFFNSRFGRD
jgi:hypothetical protein